MLAIRFAGKIKKSDGHIENRTRNENNYGFKDLTNARVKVLYKPIDKLEAIIGYNHTHNRRGETFVLAAEFPEKRVNDSNEKAEEGTKSSITTLGLTYEINDHWKIFSKSGYYDSKYTRFEDYDNTSQAGGTFNRTMDSSSGSQELKLAYQSSNIRAVLGVYYNKRDTNLNTDALNVPGEVLNPGLTGLGTLIDFNFITEQEIENKAVFGEIEYDLNNKWTIIAGVRYDIESLKNSNSTTPSFANSGLLPPAHQAGLIAQFTSAKQYDADYSAFLPKLGLVHNFNERLSLGFTAQKGYKAGGAGINLSTATTYSYDPEFTNNYEVAFRSVSANNKTTFNANVFYTNWQDMQVSVRGPGGRNDTTITNAGSSTLYGTELAIIHDLNNNVNLLASLAYVKTEYNEFNNGIEDLKGNSFIFAPELTASIGGDYFFLDNWVLSANLNYTSERYGDVKNEKKLPSKTLVNLKVGYEANNWSVYLYSRNLTNVQYANRTAVDPSPANLSPMISVGDPRFIGLQVNAEF